MRFFFLQDYQHWLLSVFLGLVLAILIYLAFRGYGYSKARAGAEAEAEEEEDYPDGLKGRNLPAPPLIIFLCLAFVVWAVFYVIYIGIKGGPF
jgi:hypothetical protein